MKCDYCLEELNDGATACPHCTREQLWAARERHKQTYGCILKLFLTVAGVIFTIFIIGGIMQRSAQIAQEKREAQEAAVAACKIFVASGDYSTDTDCIGKAKEANLDLYANSLNRFCKRRAEQARIAAVNCSVRTEGRKVCKRLNAEAEALDDITACTINERHADKAVGITIEKGWSAPKYEQL